MILITCYIVDNFIVMMRGLVGKLFLAICVVFICNTKCFAYEQIGIITDTLLTPVTYYNAYYRTPEFFAQDVRGQLLKKNVQVVSIDATAQALKKKGLRQYDLQAFQGLQQGYNLEYPLLKKIAKEITDVIIVEFNVVANSFLNVFIDSCAIASLPPNNLVTFERCLIVPSLIF